MYTMYRLMIDNVFGGIRDLHVWCSPWTSRTMSGILDCFLSLSLCHLVLVSFLFAGTLSYAASPVRSYHFTLFVYLIVSLLVSLIQMVARIVRHGDGFTLSEYTAVSVLQPAGNHNDVIDTGRNDKTSKPASSLSSFNYNPQENVARSNANYGNSSNQNVNFNNRKSSLPPTASLFHNASKKMRPVLHQSTDKSPLAGQSLPDCDDWHVLVELDDLEVERSSETENCNANNNNINNNNNDKRAVSRSESALSTSKPPLSASTSHNDTTSREGQQKKIPSGTVVNGEHSKAPSNAVEQSESSSSVADNVSQPMRRSSRFSAVKSYREPIIGGYRVSRPPSWHRYATSSGAPRPLPESRTLHADNRWGSISAGGYGYGSYANAQRFSSTRFLPASRMRNDSAYYVPRPISRPIVRPIVPLNNPPRSLRSILETKYAIPKQNVAREPDVNKQENDVRKRSVEESWNTLWESIGPKIIDNCAAQLSNRSASARTEHAEGNKSSNAGGYSNASLTSGLKDLTGKLVANIISNVKSQVMDAMKADVKLAADNREEEDIKTYTTRQKDSRDIEKTEKSAAKKEDARKIEKIEKSTAKKKNSAKTTSDHIQNEQRHLAKSSAARDHSIGSSNEASTGSGSGVQDARRLKTPAGVEKLCREVFLDLLGDLRREEENQNNLKDSSSLKQREEDDEEEEGEYGDEDESELSSASVPSGSRPKIRVPIIKPVVEPTVGQGKRQKKPSSSVRKHQTVSTHHQSKSTHHQTASPDIRDHLRQWKSSNDDEVRELAGKLVDKLYVAMQGKVEEMLSGQRNGNNSNDEDLQEAGNEIRSQIMPAIIDQIVWMIKEDQKVSDDFADPDKLADRYAQTVVSSNAVISTRKRDVIKGADKRMATKTFVVLSNSAEVGVTGSRNNNNVNESKDVFAVDEQSVWTRRPETTGKLRRKSRQVDSSWDVGAKTTGDASDVISLGSGRRSAPLTTLSTSTASVETQQSERMLSGSSRTTSTDRDLGQRRWHDDKTEQPSTRMSTNAIETDATGCVEDELEAEREAFFKSGMWFTSSSSSHAPRFHAVGGRNIYVVNRRGVHQKPSLIQQQMTEKRLDALRSSTKYRRRTGGNERYVIGQLDNEDDEEVCLTENCPDVNVNQSNNSVDDENEIDDEEFVQRYQHHQHTNGPDETRACYQSTSHAAVDDIDIDHLERRRSRYLSATSSASVSYLSAEVSEFLWCGNLVIDEDDLEKKIDLVVRVLQVQRALHSDIQEGRRRGNASLRRVAERLVHSPLGRWIVDQVLVEAKSHLDKLLSREHVCSMWLQHGRPSEWFDSKLTSTSVDLEQVVMDAAIQHVAQLLLRDLTQHSISTSSLTNTNNNVNTNSSSESEMNHQTASAKKKSWKTVPAGLLSPLRDIILRRPGSTSAGSDVNVTQHANTSDVVQPPIDLKALSKLWEPKQVQSTDNVWRGPVGQAFYYLVVFVVVFLLFVMSVAYVSLGSRLGKGDALKWLTAVAFIAAAHVLVVEPGRIIVVAFFWTVYRKRLMN